MSNLLSREDGTCNTLNLRNLYTVRKHDFVKDSIKLQQTQFL